MNLPLVVTPSSTLNPWQALWKAFRFRPWTYLLVLLIRIVISALLPLAAAWLIRTFFNTLTGQQAAGLNLWTILAFLAVIYLADVPLDILYWVTRLEAALYHRCPPARQRGRAHF